MRSPLLLLLLLSLFPAYVVGETYTDTAPVSFTETNSFGSSRYGGINLTLLKENTQLIKYRVWGPGGEGVLCVGNCYDTGTECEIFKEGVSSPISSTITDYDGYCLFSPSVQLERDTTYALTVKGTRHYYEPFATYPYNGSNINVSSGFMSGAGSAYNNFWIAITSVTTMDNTTISSCGSGDSDEVLRINFYKEESPTEIINSSGEYYGEIEGSSVFFGELLSNFSVSLCLLSENISLSSLEIKYSSGDITNFYHFLNVELDQNHLQTQNLYIINQSGSAQLTLTIRDSETYQYKEGVYVFLQRKYLSDGTWKTIQSRRVGGFGEAYFQIFTLNTQYRMVIKDEDGCTIETTAPMSFSCPSEGCAFTKVVGECINASSDSELSVSVGYSNETKLITINWNDPSFSTSNITTKTIKEGRTPLQVCYSSTESYSGTHTCNISSYSGTFLVRVFTEENGRLKMVHTSIITVPSQPLSSLLNKREASFWTFGIVLSCIGFGLISPLYTIVAAVLGLIFTLFIGASSWVNISLILIAAASGIVIGIKVKN